MGSLAYALGGAMSGAGAGLAEVGKEGYKEQLVQKESDLATARDETHERLRDSLENARIANEQAFQTKAAGAKVNFETEQKEKEIKAKHEDVATHETAATAREKDASDKKLQASNNRAAATKKVVPEFTHSTLNKAGGMVKNPVTGKYENTTGANYQILNHKSGQAFVAVGDMYLPYNAADTQFPNANSVSRAPADKLALLQQHPDKMMDFFQKYHYIPQNAVSALQQQKDNPQQQKGMPAWAKGMTASAETPLGPQQQDAEDAAEDNAPQVDDPYGEDGSPTSQPSDNEPAK